MAKKTNDFEDTVFVQHSSIKDKISYTKKELFTAIVEAVVLFMNI